jgi:hypothetical protein
VLVKRPKFKARTSSYPSILTLFCSPLCRICYQIFALPSPSFPSLPEPFLHGDIHHLPTPSKITLIKLKSMPLVFEPGVLGAKKQLFGLFVLVKVCKVFAEKFFAKIN